MTEKLHAHSALAGVELCLGGARTANLEASEVAMSAVRIPSLTSNPFKPRAIDLADIKEFDHGQETLPCGQNRLILTFFTPVQNTGIYFRN